MIELCVLIASEIWFPKVGLDPSTIKTQHMGDSGSPFFAMPVVVTTLDTFALNFFKLPAVEVNKAFKSGNTHFESTSIQNGPGNQSNFLICYCV